MGFQKVRDALAEYFNGIPLCKGIIKFIDVIAAVITVLYLLMQFFSLGRFIPALLPYTLLCTVVLAVGAKGKLGLLIAVGGQMLIGFINLTRGMISWRSFSWNALFAILFWGMLTFFTVIAINNEGMGNSVLTDFINSSNKKKGPARYCLSCGTQETNPDAGFCRTCGAKLPEIPAAPAVPPIPATPAVPASVQNPTSSATSSQTQISATPEDAQTVICPKCGKQGDSETVFCPVCGTKIK